MSISEVALSLLAIVAAAMLSAGMTWAIRPLLLRHALAKPNARSSHRIPTPQGAGIAVIAATMAVAAVVIAYLDIEIPTALFGATLLMATAGFADDVKPIPILPRLALQVIAVGTVLLTTSHDLRVVPACPLWIERSLLVLA